MMMMILYFIVAMEMFKGRDNINFIFINLLKLHNHYHHRHHHIRCHSNRLHGYKVIRNLFRIGWLLITIIVVVIIIIVITSDITITITLVIIIIIIIATYNMRDVFAHVSRSCCTSCLFKPLSRTSSFKINSQPITIFSPHHVIFLPNHPCPPPGGHSHAQYQPLQFVPSLSP